MAEPDVLTVYKDDEGEWRWTMQSGGNHEVIGASTEGYIRLADCMSNIVRVVDLTGDVEVQFASTPEASK